MRKEKVEGIVKLAITKGLERMKECQQNLIRIEFEDALCFETEEDLRAYEELNEIIAQIYKQYVDTLPF